MFSYYALETWLFSFFLILLLGFIIFYTKRLVTILTDMQKSKKVSYKPWEMEKKVAKGKVKIPRHFGPIKGLVPVRESAISSKQAKQSKSIPSHRLDVVDGIATIDGALSRSSSVGSGISYETTTTNSEFYRESRLSVSEMVKEDGSWIHRLMVDQNQNSVKNDLQAHLSAAAVENLSANLPKTTNTANNSNHHNKTNGTVVIDQATLNAANNNNNNTKNNTDIKTKETKEDDNNNYNDKMTKGNTILVTPEINEIPFSAAHEYYSSSNQQSYHESNATSNSPVNLNDDHIEMTCKTIPVLDESITSSSTTIEGNNRSTITKTTSKKVTVTEKVSKQRKLLESRIAV